MKSWKLLFGTVALGLMGFLAPAHAANVLCSDSTKNHMFVSDSFVSQCMASGVGNIGQGKQANDAWLKALPSDHGYSTLGDQWFTQSGTSGTFSINDNYWNTYSDLFIGFKFGTGNQADTWFVYELKDRTSSGTWDFVNVFGKGGGLSHVTAYGKGTPETSQVPEPGVLALLALGLLAAGVLRRKA